MFKLTSIVRRLGLCALTCVLGIGIAVTVVLLGQPPRAALAIADSSPNRVTPMRRHVSEGLSPTPNWVATGEAISNSFGASVATAGDINGDGFSDALVGAYQALSYTGQVYVYMGTANGLSASPALTLTGSGSEVLGIAVATAGDVNGDGYADVLIGASGYMTSTGRVYLYTGSASGLNPTPFFTATGETTLSSFGVAVGSAGDVNADGYSDIIVGAAVYSNSTGRTYVYYGASSIMSATPAFTATGEASGYGFGGSVGTAGDVNGDGYADIVVGASDYNGFTGQAYVYYSSASGLSPTPNFTATGVTVSSLGIAVGTAGDVNGDGYADVLIGAPVYTAMQYGVVQIYTGSVNGLASSPAFTVTATFTNTAYGYSASTAGDVNGDGYADMVIGSFGTYMTGTGYADVYYGSANGIGSTPAFTVTGEITNSNFGRVVNTAGDVNGDGYADIIIGAPGYMSSTGRAYIYHGGPDAPTNDPALTLTGGTSAWLGQSVATAGDVNGDGYADVVIGAPGYFSDTGQAYLYLGSASGLSSTPAFTATGEAPNNLFGGPVQTAGDINGDGYDDVMIGATGYLTLTGRAYLYLGSASGLEATPVFTTTGEVAGLQLGAVVGTAGDVNGDGYGDILVGDGLTIQVYLGAMNGISLTPVFTAPTTASPVIAAGTAGDVNGDGYSDIVVGDSGYYSSTGRVNLYLGSNTGLSATPAFTMTGLAPYDGLGYSVRTAGDVDGDGYADIVVSAAGRVNVFMGSLNGPNATPAFTVTYPGAQYLPVATTGDVNGDGYADVVVGNALSVETFIYFGSASGLDTLPITFTDGLTGTGFGASVSTAGDVNGDGYAEVIVGGSVFNSGNGYALLYAGNAAYGLPLLPQQRRADDSAPIAHNGQSDNPNSFRLAALGRTPFGRGLVKLEWEVKPLGVPFDGAGLGRSADWLDTGTAGVALNELITGLSFNTQYHWRVRLRYHPASLPFQPYSRWVTQPWNGWQEADLRTAMPIFSYTVYLPVLER